VRFGHFRERAFTNRSPGVRLPQLAGGVVCNAVKPLCEQIAGANARGLVGQNEKCRLKRVVRVRGVAEDSPAHTQHHRPVPSHDGRKRLFVSQANEQVEKLPVGAVSPRGLFGDGCRESERLCSPCSSAKPARST